MKNAFEETFPDISKYATMKLIKGNAKGEQTLTFTINDDIMKADVVLCQDIAWRIANPRKHTSPVKCAGIYNQFMDIKTRSNHYYLLPAI